MIEKGIFEIQSDIIDKKEITIMDEHVIIG